MWITKKIYGDIYDGYDSLTTYYLSARVSWPSEGTQDCPGEESGQCVVTAVTSPIIFVNINGNTQSGVRLLFEMVDPGPYQFEFALSKESLKWNELTEYLMLADTSFVLNFEEGEALSPAPSMSVGNNSRNLPLFEFENREFSEE